jgi:hypothetical protein
MVCCPSRPLHLDLSQRKALAVPASIHEEDYTLSDMALTFEIDMVPEGSPKLRLEIESGSLSDWISKDLLKASDGREGENAKTLDIGSQGPTVSSGVTVSGSAGYENEMTDASEARGSNPEIAAHPSSEIITSEQTLSKVRDQISSLWTLSLIFA